MDLKSRWSYQKRLSQKRKKTDFLPFVLKFDLWQLTPWGYTLPGRLASFLSCTAWKRWEVSWYVAPSSWESDCLCHLGASDLGVGHTRAWCEVGDGEEFDEKEDLGGEAVGDLHQGRTLRWESLESHSWGVVSMGSGLSAGTLMLGATRPAAPCQGTHRDHTDGARGKGRVGTQQQPSQACHKVGSPCGLVEGSQDGQRGRVRVDCHHDSATKNRLLRCEVKTVDCLCMSDGQAGGQSPRSMFTHCSVLWQPRLSVKICGIVETHCNKRQGGLWAW